MDFSAKIDQYLKETSEIVSRIDRQEIARMIALLSDLKANGGRLFILGSGGSAANASHAVSDFRKLAGIEAYAPTDNTAELTARTNDDGWDTTFSKWLEISKLCEKDALLVLSVGGSSATTSLNIKEAIDYAVQKKSKITAIVSREGGYAKRNADACVLVPVASDAFVGFHALDFQEIVWHLVVSALKLSI